MLPRTRGARGRPRTGSVIADLGHDPGSELRAEAGEAGDDRGVGVSGARPRCGLEVAQRDTDGVELADQTLQLEAVRVFEGGGLVQGGLPQVLLKRHGFRVDTAGAAGAS